MSRIFPKFENILRLTSREDLNKLLAYGCINNQKERCIINVSVPPKTLVKISGMGDFSSDCYKDLKFVNADSVMVSKTDKNWIYYWFRRNRCFPDATNIYLFSHPCEPIVIDSFLNSRWSDKAELSTIYLTVKPSWVLIDEKQTVDANEFAEDWIREAETIANDLKITDLKISVEKYKIEN